MKNTVAALYLLLIVGFFFKPDFFHLQLYQEWIYIYFQITNITKLNQSKTSSEMYFLFPCPSFGIISWERPKTSELCLYLTAVCLPGSTNINTVLKGKTSERKFPASKWRWNTASKRYTLKSLLELKETFTMPAVRG